MKLKTGTTVLAALLAMAGTALAGDYSTWAKYRSVTVNTTGLGLSGAVTNIPLLVRFNATDHADMFTGANPITAGGADVRVTLADGTTDVPFEIETATTGASGRLVLWIKASSVAQNSATAASFRVFWGKTGQTTMSNSTAVFDTANGFAAVWHMNQTVAVAKDSILDATANKNTAKLGLTGTIAVPADSATGLGIGKFFETASNANGAFFYVKDSSTTVLSQNTNNGPYTISAWAKPIPVGTATTCGSGNDRFSIISKYNNNNVAGTRQFALQTANGGDWRMTNNPSAFAGIYKTNNEYVADTACALNTWQYVVGTYSLTGTPDTTAASAMNLKISVNGANFKAGVRAAQADSLSIGPNAPLFIGRMHSTVANNNRFFRGTLDEVRVSKVARSQDWVKLEYETQRPTGVTAVTVGSSVTNGGPYSAWTGVKEIVMNTTATGAKVNATVTNFPVLVRLGTQETAILTAAKTGGADIRFSKADGVTALPYQIESWSATQAAIWVKVDTILGNNGTQKIIMYYGNAAANSESNPSAVFDTAQFHAVYHMNDATNQLDATGRAANTATASTPAPVAQTASLIGAGKTFNGSTAFYKIGTDSTALNLNTNVGPYALSAWVKPASCDTRIAAIAKYSNSNDISGRQYALHTGNTATSWRFTNGAPALTGAGDVEFFADAPETCVPNNWSFVVGTYRSLGTPTSDSSVNAKIYVNGALIASGTTASITGTSLGTSSHTYIGRIATDERYMNGDLDEIRVSKVFRDSNWVRLNYENQKAVNSLVNIGNPPLSAPSAPTITAVTPGARNSASITVTWTAPTSNGNSPITGYKAYATGADSTKFCTTTTGLSCTVTGLTPGAPYTFIVRATNAIGSTNSTASSSVNAPTPIAGPGSLLLSVGHFTRAYTFVLPASAAAVTDEMTMTISDVWGRTVWSKTVAPSELQRGELTWNGLSANGQKVGMGVYIVRVKTFGEGKAKEVSQMGVKLRN